jgi:Uma2 family endonuclease
MRGTAKLTYADYAAVDDGCRYELLAGELYVVPAPSPMHQRSSKRLQRQLEEYFEKKGLGEVFNAPVDVIFGEHDVAEPDILVAAKPGQISQRGIEGAPLLVVEVTSPSSRQYDCVQKAGWYLEHGVKHYWILNPERRSLTCRIAAAGIWVIVADSGGDERVVDPSWPELTIDLAKVWQP